jgi:hypothetical protein
MLIRPIKFGDDKSKAPASLFSLAGAWLDLQPFHLDSTFAASESHSFSRGSRRDSRDYGYRYGVFRVTHRIHISMSTPLSYTSTPIQTHHRRRIGTLNVNSCGRDADNLVQAEDKVS